MSRMLIGRLFPPSYWGLNIGRIGWGVKIIMVVPPMCRSRLGQPFTGGNLMQALDVVQRRRTKQAVVFPAELGRALVADPECRGRRIQALGEHQQPGFMQPQPLLELQGTHSRQGAEVVMEVRGAHPGVSRQVIDPERLLEVALQPLDGPPDLMALASRCPDLAAAFPGAAAAVAEGRTGCRSAGGQEKRGWLEIGPVVCYR